MNRDDGRPRYRRALVNGARLGRARHDPREDPSERRIARIVWLVYFAVLIAAYGFAAWWLFFRCSVDCGG